MTATAYSTLRTSDIIGVAENTQNVYCSGRILCVGTNEHWASIMKLTDKKKCML